MGGEEMCGRLKVIREPVCRQIRQQLGIAFHTESNDDLRPTQRVATVLFRRGELVQQNLFWGIHPEWARHVIINAKAETVGVKSTFIDGFEQARVIVPCSGWYEWREETSGKRKYSFTAEERAIFYMAGIALERGEKLVTLTTEANEQCRHYHARMPLLIEPDCLMTWLSGSLESVYPLLINPSEQPLKIQAQ